MTNNSHARVSLAQSDHSQPPRASLTGPIAPQQILTVSVITRRKKPLHLHELGGHILSHQEFTENYGGDPADFDTLRGMAHELGLTVDETASSLARRTLVLRGPAAAMEKAFGVTLQTYQHLDLGCHFHAFEGSIHIAEEHAAPVVAVLGLDTRPIARPHIRRTTATTNASGAVSFHPPQVAALYRYPTGLTGAGQTIGILELGGGYTTSDINTYFSGLGLPPPTVVAVSVDGGTNAPSNPNGADGEVALDIQVAGSIAPSARIAVYFAPNTDQGFIDAITTAVHDTANKPSVLSISWGGPESSWSASSRTALDDACQSAGALGVTITVASGDSGSSDGGSGNNVDFPASSPHVLACGGTELKGSGTTISSEIVWDDLASGGGATGGGVSTVFALPTWQSSAGVPASSSGKGGRGVPDVAGDAAPSTGYDVLIDGQAGTVGGTSAVAPLWAALVALINQGRATAGASPAGFLNPTLYANPTAFRDITVGNNGSYQAKAGWDACTGLGSPNGSAIAGVLGVSGSGTGGTGGSGTGSGGTGTGSGGSGTGSGSGSGTGTGSGGAGGGSGTGSGGSDPTPPVHKKKHHPKHPKHHTHDS